MASSLRNEHFTLYLAIAILLPYVAFARPARHAFQTRNPEAEELARATLIRRLEAATRTARLPATAPSPFTKYVGRGVVFWHIPKTGGTSLSTALFNHSGIPAPQRRTFTVENEDDCNQAIHRAISYESPKVWHIHHKDFTMAVALKRAGFKLITVLRHPVLRAISEYNYKKYWRKIDPGFELTTETLKQMISSDNLVRTLSRADWWWSVSCDWSRCNSVYCTGLQEKTKMHWKNPDWYVKHAAAVIRKTFDVVHCLEHDERQLIESLESKLGLTLPDLPLSNANTHRVTANLSAADLDQLRQSSRDYKLYLEICGEDVKNFPYTA